MSSFGRRIRPFGQAELEAVARAESAGVFRLSFTHLERAHVLGQASTVEHVRVHWRMFLRAVKRSRMRECVGQMLRIVGAATMTALGFVPHGNTGGTNASPLRRMPIPPDLAALIAEAKSKP